MKGAVSFCQTHQTPAPPGTLSWIRTISGDYGHELINIKIRLSWKSGAVCFMADYMPPCHVVLFRLCFVRCCCRVLLLPLCRREHVMSCLYVVVLRCVSSLPLLSAALLQSPKPKPKAPKVQSVSQFIQALNRDTSWKMLCCCASLFVSSNADELMSEFISWWADDFVPSQTDRHNDYNKIILPHKADKYNCTYHCPKLSPICMLQQITVVRGQRSKQHTTQTQKANSAEKITKSTSNTPATETTLIEPPPSLPPLQRCVLRLNCTVHLDG